MDGTDNKERFARSGIRNTKQRNLIFDVLKGSDLPLTAEAIYKQLGDDHDSISLSTVYRVLEVFVTKGLAIKCHVSEDNRAMFELDRLEHKHHLTCIECHKMIAIDHCPLEGFERSLEKKTSFDIIGHKLQMYGRCPDCR